MNIEHLVFCGGGPVLFSYLGLFDEFFKYKIIDIKKIKTIYSVSSGSIIALLIMLNIDIEIIKNFFINCPWEKIIPFDSTNILNLINLKGMYDGKVIIEKMFKSLFDSIDLSMEITLKEMYEKTKIDFHCFTVNIKDFTLVNINYENEPDLKILDAIHMSIAVPLLISPLYYKNNYYVDGAVIKNYPIDIILKEQNCEIKSILGIRVFNKKNQNKEIDNKIDDKSSIYEYIKCFFNYFKILSNKDITESLIEYEIHMPGDGVNMDSVLKTINNKEYREQLYENGVICAKTFLKYKNIKI